MEGWGKATIGEASLIRPRKKEAKAKLDGQDEVSFVPMETLGIRKKDFDGTQVRPLNKVYGGYTYFANGDVLLAKITPCFQNGKLGIASGLKNGTGFGSSEFFVFRCADQLDKEFLFYFLSQDTFLDEGVAQMSGAVGHQRVPLEFIENYPIPLPPLAEQGRIVAILDEAFAAIATATASAEKNFANARGLLDSCLEAAFEPITSASHTPLADLCHADRVITYGVVKLGQEHHNGVPCLRTSNVRRLCIDTDRIKRIGPTLSARFKRTVLYGGEVLVSVRGTLGGVAVVPDSMSGWNVSREVAVVPANPDLINSEFLALCIATRASQEWLSGVLKGVAYTGINIGDLRALPISVPPKGTQLQIVRHIKEGQTSADTLRVVYQSKLNRLTELKQSILHRAFTGALTSEPNAADRSLSEAGL